MDDSLRRAAECTSPSSRHLLVPPPRWKDRTHAKFKLSLKLGLQCDVFDGHEHGPWLILVAPDSCAECFRHHLASPSVVTTSTLLQNMLRRTVRKASSFEKPPKARVWITTHDGGLVLQRQRKGPGRRPGTKTTAAAGGGELGAPAGRAEGDVEPPVAVDDGAAAPDADMQIAPRQVTPHPSGRPPGTRPPCLPGGFLPVDFRVARQLRDP